MGLCLSLRIDVILGVRLRNGKPIAITRLPIGGKRSLQRGGFAARFLVSINNAVNADHSDGETDLLCWLSCGHDGPFLYGALLLSTYGAESISNATTCVYMTRFCNVVFSMLASIPLRRVMARTQSASNHVLVIALPGLHRPKVNRRTMPKQNQMLAGTMAGAIVVGMPTTTPIAIDVVSHRPASRCNEGCKDCWNDWH